MKKYFVKNKRWLAFLLLLLMMVTAILPGTSVFADTNQFTVKVDLGYDSQQEVGVHVPVAIVVTNNGSDFKGTVQVTVPTKDGGNVMYEQELSLAKGATKKVTMAPKFYVDGNEIRVAIVDKKGKEVYSAKKSTNIASSRNCVRVGVLSDDSSVARLLDKRSIMSTLNYGLYMSTVDLNQDNIPDNFEAMDSIDVIVISNFSTDVLSEKQINALLDWASNGGLLLIGTGDSYKKTLAGFGDKLKYTDKGFKDVSTDFGASNSALYDYNDYDNIKEKVSKLLYEESSTLNDIERKLLRGSSNCQEIYNALINEIDNAVANNEGVILEHFADVLWDEGCTYFADCFYYSPYWCDDDKNYWYDSFEYLHQEALEGNPSGMYNNFKDYIKRVAFAAFAIECIEARYPDINNAETYVYQTEAQYTGGSYSIDSGAYVDATIWDFVFGDMAITGLDKKTDNSINVFQIEYYGEGYIAMAAMDFSKKPFSEYPGNTGVLTALIEKLIGVEVYTRANNYNSSPYAYSSNVDPVFSKLLSQIQSDSPVPVFAYFLIFGAYIAGCFILYSVFKKKKKSIILWPVVAGTALVAAIVVYLMSFSTKSVSPIINVIRVVNADDVAGVVDNYCTITLPKNKTYRVNFDENMAFNKIEDSNYVYNYGYSLSSLDKYAMGFSEKDGKKEVIFNSSSILESQYFSLTDTSFEHGGVSLTAQYSSGILVGSITNNYGHDLTNCSLIFNSCVCPIGTLKNGETLDLSTLPLVGVLRNGYWADTKSIRDKAIFGEQTQWQAVLFGLGGKNVIQRNALSNALSYIVDKKDIPNLAYNYSGTNVQTDSNYLPLINTTNIVFVGYNEKAEKLTKGGVTEITTEVVYKEANR